MIESGRRGGLAVRYELEEGIRMKNHRCWLCLDILKV